MATGEFIRCHTLDNELLVMRAMAPSLGLCAEKQRLKEVFLRAIADLNALHGKELDAVLRDSSGAYEAEIQAARDARESVKSALLAHIQSHGCASGI